MRVRRFDVGSVSGVEITAQGYLRCDGAITKTGVFTYRNGDGSMRRELRLPDEVFHRDAIESFGLAPLTNDHPGEPLNPENTRKYQVGVIANPHRDDDTVVARIQITDARTIRDVRGGKWQLSCGYDADLEPRAGVTMGIDGIPDGLTYDGIQRMIRGNHVALVDVARAGPGARLRLDGDDAEMVLDRDPSTIQTLIFSKKQFSAGEISSWLKEHGFHQKKAPDETEESIRIRQRDPGEFEAASFRTIEIRPGVKAVIGTPKKIRADAPKQEKPTMKKITIDGITFEVSESAAQGIGKALEHRDALAIENKDLKASLQKEKARADKAQEDFEAEAKARKDAESPVAVRERLNARLKLEREASKILGDEVKLDALTDEEIKTKVVIATAKDPGAAETKLDGCDPIYLNARYDSAIEGFEPVEPEKKPNEALARVRIDANKASGSTAEQARKRMIERNHKAGREPLRSVS